MNHQEEIAEKTERLVKMTAAENLGGVLINSQPNFSWATAGASNAVDTSSENGVASLLFRNDGKRFVIASRIEMPRILAEEVSEKDFEPIEYAWEDEKAQANFLTATASSLLDKGAALGADLNFGAGARVVESPIADCRYRLTESEIERYKTLGADAGAAIGALAKTLQPGQSEWEIARMTAHALAAHNIQSIVTLVAADERLQKYRHPVPTAKTWEKVLMIVVCARRHGLIASLTRIVCAGEIPDELRRRTDSAARVNARLFAATRPGATGAELYKIAADAYAAEGFANEQNLHHQGGAAGYRPRDWTAHPASRDVVQPNQAFAWNPSISGTKVEETCIAREDGIETITASPDWAQIPVEAGGRTYFLPGVLSV